jgi:hypothetical protein
VAELKDNINEMIRNLRDTTRKNMEQDWLKTNLPVLGCCRASATWRGSAHHERAHAGGLGQFAAFYVPRRERQQPLKLISSTPTRPQAPSGSSSSARLAGQCALERRCIVVHDVPENYVSVSSARSTPRNLVVVGALRGA